VTITSPPDNIEYIIGSTVDITATASDDRQLTKIELYLDNSLVKTCTVSGTSATCTYTATPSLGTHTIRAVAYDSCSQTGEATKSFQVLPYQFRVYYADLVVYKKLYVKTISMCYGSYHMVGSIGTDSIVGIGLSGPGFGCGEDYIVNAWPLYGYIECTLSECKLYDSNGNLKTTTQSSSFVQGLINNCKIYGCY